MDGFAGWYADFWRLSSERQVGFGVGPIPASKIEDHIRGWLTEDADMFEHCIREMDGVYMKKVNSSDRPSTDQPAVSPREAFRAATANRRR